MKRLAGSRPSAIALHRPAPAEAVCPVPAGLKRRHAVAAPAPRELGYAVIGYLGILYESQLVYLKQKLEAPELSARDADVVAALESAYLVLLEMVSRLFANEGIDSPALRDLANTHGQALRRLVDEGRDLVAQMQERREP